ncbi:tRNA (uridine(34)/cytosine(34)/5-carboxymethylaminomethyluridine(34)-2'-O)-methyltransferase TrmL [Solemya pervernicosa gill symbiont]|uniref:tRNA (cytidine(34)-2'-O)-methyltransferase n=2 Tax=Gammaproteobacteria incertae sedis TaxID=118884 RepID=A0A1T2L3C9_9GAMM|nr:tRNA (uridine(34)/cytosine(34)/5-carboxymethylaminomethyluridine(34)-2'-O)-methyltransferase TrmL [Candidatus Reidiella endopervernicosa]OOZ39617.1 tRNA (uridine(34)/cytosine(34)/5-carboxymethylaminomethyluridine(34)-2'-O)-methyltransferase TrmL [Solemya pervernicosa gill symbiont]QKQ25452.1 tRNA (uridine(34)/cytosine(34)/5-carboxymethylaminomethyluridine(34)-2'-O)-methyltransferase TrmL [Candidatus Reidiella endopervernicosa]
MFHIALYEPEIAPNTGNIIRLCANSGSQLHLIHPLGFELDDKRLRRAGLDYHEFANVAEYDSFANFREALPEGRVFALSTRGRENYDRVAYRADDILLFGPETRGLPAELLESLPTEQRLRIPMMPNNRSLNLSNATALVLYEAWRQHGFSGSV